MAFEAFRIAVTTALLSGRVVRQSQAFGLAPFLKHGFAVEQMGPGQNVGCGLLPMGREPVMDGLQVVAAAAVNRTDQRLGGIGLEGCLCGRIPQCFRSQHKEGFQLKLLPQLCQPTVTHQLSPQTRATAHREVGVVLVDELRGS